MSVRLFEEALHASAYAKFRPSPPNKLIRKIIDYVCEKLDRPLQCAVDVGCGNGQSTAILAPYFDAVIGQDVSPAQIDEALKAKKHNNVSYKVSAAEKLIYPSSSVELVTACQAAHWFDLPQFYKETDRILKPGGVLALYGYQLPVPVYAEKGEQLKHVVNDFYLKETHKYWDDRRVHVDNGYTNYVLPYPQPIRDDSFVQEMSASVEELVGYITTWSGFQAFRKKDQDKADKALEKFRTRVMTTTGATTSPTDTQLTIRFPYFLLLSRKP